MAIFSLDTAKWPSEDFQWLETSLFSAEGMGSIPGQEAKIPHASRPKKQNIKQAILYEIQ